MNGIPYIYLSKCIRGTVDMTHGGAADCQALTNPSRHPLCACQVECKIVTIDPILLGIQYTSYVVAVVVEQLALRIMFPFGSGRAARGDQVTISGMRTCASGGSLNRWIVRKLVHQEIEDRVFKLPRRLSQNSLV